MSRAERNCTSGAEQNCTTERRGVNIKVSWSSLTRSQAETEGDMGLAGAAVAKSDDVILAVDVLAPGQFQHQDFVQRGDSLISNNYFCRSH